MIAGVPGGYTGLVRKLLIDRNGQCPVKDCEEPNLQSKSTISFTTTTEEGQ